MKSTFIGAAITYFAILFSYLILDGIWLGVVSKDAYIAAMQGMLRKEYPITPWIAFYLMYSGATAYLVVFPNVQASWKKVATAGAVLGVASYGAYNLTNYAILEGWPLSITLKDWLWGTVVSSLISVAGWFSLNKYRTRALS